MATKRRVLVADDDPSLLRLISVTLGTDDFDLLQARDGQEALEVLRRRRPDLVLLDSNMPRLDGFQVCAQLKHDPETADIKVVMLTARGSAADRARARECGADDYFVKPFSPIRLLNTVYALLE
jgi:DNA-binding response OmpR family regulator